MSEGARASAREGLSDRLRLETSALHRAAERSGVLRDVLTGRASRSAYALFLRSLLPVYEQLELGLSRHASLLGEVADPALYRSVALRSDVEALCGRAWERQLPLLGAAERYAACIASAAAAGGVAELLAHAYVRFLGDLNGGVVVQRALARALDLPPRALAFYAYPSIADLVAFRTRYRAAIDRVGGALDGDAAARAARAAFQANVDVSTEVAEYAAARLG